MIERALSELSTKTREIVEAANRVGAVKIVRHLRGGELWCRVKKGTETACYVVGVAEYERLLAAANAGDTEAAKAAALFNRGLE